MKYESYIGVKYNIMLIWYSLVLNNLMCNASNKLKYLVRHIRYKNASFELIYILTY